MSNISFHDIESTPSNLDSDITDDMINVYKYRRSVKIFSIIDFIFNIVYFASYASYYFMFTCLISLMGYYGAREYDSCYSKTYLYWNIFCLLGQSVLMGMFINNNYSTLVDNNTLGLYILIGGFSILIKGWITKIIYSFNKALDSVSNEQILTLKYIGSIPKIITYYYW
jgi:hypothetical protein